MSNDAIVLLKEDHKEIRKVFREFQEAGENATRRKGELVDKIIELLTVHTYIENEVMYPRVRELLPDLEDDVLESYEEHHVADVLVVELSMMKPDDERFDAKTTVLIENVKHHMDEEEQDWFPKVREGLGRKALQEIGEELLAAREKAPTPPVAAERPQEDDRRGHRLTAWSPAALGVQAAQDLVEDGLALEADARALARRDPAALDDRVVREATGGLELTRVGLVAAELEGGRDVQGELVPAVRDAAPRGPAVLARACPGSGRTRRGRSSAPGRPGSSRGRVACRRSGRGCARPGGRRGSPRWRSGGGSARTGWR